MNQAAHTDYFLLTSSDAAGLAFGRGMLHSDIMPDNWNWSRDGNVAPSKGTNARICVRLLQSELVNGLPPDPLPLSRVVRIDIADDNPVNRARSWKAYPNMPIPPEILFSRWQPDNSPTDAPLFKAQPVGAPGAFREFDRQLGLIAYLRTVGCLYSATGSYDNAHPDWQAVVGAYLDGSPLQPSLSWLPAFWGALPNPPRPVHIICTLARTDDVWISPARIKEILNEQRNLEKFSPDVSNSLHLFFAEDWLGARDSAKCIRENGSAWAALLMLMRFGNRGTDHPGHLNLKQQLARDWPAEFAPGILATLGYFYGYRHLHRCEERLHGVSPELQHHFTKNAAAQWAFPAIKFNLSSQSERRLIEAVYQRCFNDRNLTDDVLKLLDSLQPAKSAPEKTSSWNGGLYCEKGVSAIGWSYQIFRWEPKIRIAELLEVKPDIVPSTHRLFFSTNFWNAVSDYSALSSNVKKPLKTAWYKGIRAFFDAELREILLTIWGDKAVNEKSAKEPKAATKRGKKRIGEEPLPDKQSSPELPAYVQTEIPLESLSESEPVSANDEGKSS